jgi:hypothetical protein
VLDPYKLFKPGLTNILASYENSYITEVKSFITLGPEEMDQIYQGPYSQTFFLCNLRTGQISQEVVPGGPFKPSVMFLGNATAWPRG